MNLVESLLVVFREREKGSYQVRLSLDEKSTVAPQAWPELTFEVSAFLPPALSDEPR